MYYLRKITRRKWPEEHLMPQATLRDIQADTVQAEFKTDHNKLSVWQVNSDKDLIDAFIALGANCDYIGTIDAIEIDEQDIGNLLLEKEEGDTPTNDINDKHYNIVDLNFESLGEVIMSIICGLRKDRYLRKTKSDMKKILINAYKESKLDWDRLKPTLKAELENEIMRND